MLAVACAHLSIKDSQFDLKGNCTLLYYIKKCEEAARLRNRFATKSAAAAPETFFTVQILVCKTTTVRTEDGEGTTINPS